MAAKHTPGPWVKDGAGWIADMGSDVTLFVSPEHTTGGYPARAKRGTFWRAGASVWDEATRTISRYGRDEYSVKYNSWKDAQRGAERIYFEAHGETP